MNQKAASFVSFRREVLRQGADSATATSGDARGGFTQCGQVSHHDRKCTSRLTAFRRRGCVRFAYWAHHSTEGSYFELVNVTAEHLTAMQALVDFNTDKASHGGTKIGMDRDGNGMTHSGFKVVRVERVENAKAFFAYHARTATLQVSQTRQSNRVQVKTETCICQLIRSANLNRSRNEKSLFHGCLGRGSQMWRRNVTTQERQPSKDHGADRDILSRTSQEGFEESVAWVGCMLGAGHYFAEMWDKADRYCERYSCQETSQGEQVQLFVSRVCLGSPHVTKCSLKGLRCPPWSF